MPIHAPTEDSTITEILKWFSRPSVPHSDASLQTLKRVNAIIADFTRTVIVACIASVGARPLLLTGGGDGTPIIFRHNVAEKMCDATVLRRGCGSAEFYCRYVAAGVWGPDGRMHYNIDISEPTPMSFGKSAMAEVTIPTRLTKTTPISNGKNNSKTGSFRKSFAAS